MHKVKKQITIIIRGSTKTGRLRAIKDLMRAAAENAGEEIYDDGKKVKLHIDKLARAVEAGEADWIIDTDR